MTTVDTDMGEFTKSRYDGLVKAYKLALKNKVTSFKFDERYWTADYAKHMIEYLSSTFKKMK